MIDQNTFEMQFQPGSTISGIVGGFVDNGDDFTLNFRGGSAIVDPSPLEANQLGLNIDEPVNVLVGEVDGIEIDTGFITRPNGSIILGDRPTFTSSPSPIDLDLLTGENPVSFTQRIDPLISPRRTTISGEIIRMVDNDEFLLRTDDGRVRVDADLPDTQFLNLTQGQRVNVVGEFDDGDFDAFSITDNNNNPILPGSSPETTISGTVIRMVDNDEFLLRTDDGRVRVDADLPDTQFLNLTRGQQVNVVGEFDDGDFDAFSITDNNNNPILPGSSPAEAEISIRDVTIKEGNRGRKFAQFRVSLDGASDEVVRVNYSTVDGTAEAGVDYLSRRGVIRFQPGQTTRNIRVPILGDRLTETDEIFQVNLSNARNGIIIDSQGQGTIRDND